MLPVVIGSRSDHLQEFRPSRAEDRLCRAQPQGWPGNLTTLFSGPLGRGSHGGRGPWLPLLDLLHAHCRRQGRPPQAHLFRRDLPPGRIIALSGQKGPQAEILGPGFHFRPLLNVLYEVEKFDVVKIPEGYYGQITTTRWRSRCRKACSSRPSFPMTSSARMLNARDLH